MRIRKPANLQPKKRKKLRKLLQSRLPNRIRRLPRRIRRKLRRIRKKKSRIKNILRTQNLIQKSISIIKQQRVVTSMGKPTNLKPI